MKNAILLHATGGSPDAGGTLIIRHGEGHMGSTAFHQPYREFPLLIQLVR